MPVLRFPSNCFSYANPSGPAVTSFFHILGNVVREKRKSTTLNTIFINDPAKSYGIPDTQPTRPSTELSKIREYSARLSRIVVLLFNTLITKRSLMSLLEKS